MDGGWGVGGFGVVRRGGCGGFTPWGGGVCDLGGIALRAMGGRPTRADRSRRSRCFRGFSRCGDRGFLQFAEDLGGGLAADLAVAGVGGEVGGQVGQAQPRGDLGLGLGDVQADLGDAADVAGGLLDLRTGRDLGQFIDRELVDVAEAERVAVGVVEVGEDAGGVGRWCGGRGGRGGRGAGDRRTRGCLGCVHGPKIPGGGGGSRGKGGMSRKRRTEAVIGDFSGRDAAEMALIGSENGSRLGARETGGVEVGRPRRDFAINGW